MASNIFWRLLKGIIELVKATEFFQFYLESRHSFFFINDALLSFVLVAACYNVDRAWAAAAELRES